MYICMEDASMRKKIYEPSLLEGSNRFLGYFNDGDGACISNSSNSCLIAKPATMAWHTTRRRSRNIWVGKKGKFGAGSRLQRDCDNEHQQPAASWAGEQLHQPAFLFQPYLACLTEDCQQIGSSCSFVRSTTHFPTQFEKTKLLFWCSWP